MLKGIISAIFLAVVCTFLYGQQPSIATFLKGRAPVEVIPGMFTTYRSDKHIYWEIPDSLIGREFAVTTTILTAPARPDRDMEKKFGYSGDMVGPVFFSFRKQGDELWMMDPQHERVIENPEGTYAKIAAQRGNERLYKILPVKARNQGSSLVEIGEVLKDFPLFTLDIVSFDLLISTRLREKDCIKEIKGYDNRLLIHASTILQYVVKQPLTKLEVAEKYDIQVNLCGGGFTGQSQALRLAIARALVKINPEDKKALRSEGFMTRDSRSVERKKPGRPKARRRFQFSKR